MYFIEKYSPRSKNPILQLVENKYIKGRRRQELIVSLGTNMQIDKSIRKHLARAIKQKLMGQIPLWIDDEIKVIADNIIKKIQTDGKWDSVREQVNKSKIEDDETAEVFINQVEHSYDRELGPVLIGHSFWEKLSIGDILQQCGFSKEAVKTTEISILNRLISGDSENAIPSWIKVNAISDIIDKAAESFSRDRFYRISDKLLDNQEAIERLLYQKEQSIFGLRNTIYLYDLTNTYFEGLCQQNPKAQYNKNQKEKRTDCPQIVVALVLDEDGFVRRHFTFKGKMSDSKSLEKIINALRSDFKNSQIPTIVMDRGVVSDDNITMLEKEGLKYIVASRNGEEKEFIDEFLKHDTFRLLKKDKTNEVEIKIKKQGDINYLLCKSSGRKNKETAMRNRFEQKLVDSLKGLKKLIETGKRNAPETVNQAIGRIRERHSKAAHYYEIQYIPFKFEYRLEEPASVPRRLLNSLEKRKERTDNFEINYLKLNKEIKSLKNKYSNGFEKIKIEISAPQLLWSTIEEKKQKSVSLDGNYLLKTNRNDLNDEQIWHTYVMLTKVEKAFRNLKTDLALRPNQHHLQDRVDGHVFISILAYHLLHAIEYCLRQKGEHLSWASVKRIVSSHSYSTTILPTKAGPVIHLRKPGLPESVHEYIYNKLD
ncbi:MAG: IS1634 family transposase, partial [Parcubacteria group bacterium]|nr:IS1634 family transposase [Parcubacteria group bacterium]